ncbi:NAD(P)-binding domain-containing protein [Streptomyces europaeiscabiei]|uniref:NAD(P)-binding domain-containing protein n=1 Tax=Streptomyces europaeiscabiei TaxID=146819 RepID=UPI000765BA63|nr:NAD(P)-binding domain-containing protein [Streptomyces europaeiscabiei]MDX3668954.1 NAD(P)-binding domain-containing protein [Streptomyces europaeiscabiei]MDX3780612.1 NAD(P)-binding domain-containing protein [Streptomyces europaeiscabiei]
MYDLLVVGAGPYGLSIASHAAAAGLSLRVLGRPMASWRDHMPPGMFLKSEPWASNLSDPEGRWRLDVYCAEQGFEARHGRPIPVGTFASYGLWFARNALPSVDERMVTRLQRWCGGFEAVLNDGEVVRARTVALAVGVVPFVEVPSVLRGLPPARVSHSSHHRDLDRFRGGDVTVIGGGQAALETAALLAEQGTRVRVLARSGTLRWNDVPPPLERSLWQSARSPHSGLGCGWRNWFYAERPGWYRRLPEARRVRVADEALGPAGAWWVRDRVEPAVEVRLGQEVAVAYETGGAVRLETVGRGGELTSLDTEHVIAATGFRPTCERLDLLAGDVRADVVPLADGSPSVGRDFESSVPGLFLAGLTTAAGFGPAMRFVYGASYTAPALVRGVRQRLRSGVPGGRIPVPEARADLAPTTGA